MNRPSSTLLLAAMLLGCVLGGCRQVDSAEAYIEVVDAELILYDEALETALSMQPDEAAVLLEDLLAARDRVVGLDVPDGVEAFADNAVGYMDLVIRMVEEIVLETCPDCAREYGAQAGAQSGVLDRDRIQPRGGH